MILQDYVDHLLRTFDPNTRVMQYDFHNGSIKEPELKSETYKDDKGYFKNSWPSKTKEIVLI